MLSKLASTTWTLTRGWPALPPKAALDETTGSDPSRASSFMDASSSSEPTAYRPLPSDGANDSAKSRSGPGPLLATDKAPAGSGIDGASGFIFLGVLARKSAGVLREPVRRR